MANNNDDEEDNEVESEIEDPPRVFEDNDEIQEDESGQPLDIIDDVSGSYFEDIIILRG